MKQLASWKKAFGVTVALMAMTGWSFAADGGLDMATIDKIQSEFQMDSFTRAMYNAVSNNDIVNLAINRDLVRENNNLYNHKIKTKGITNQQSSGRCWLFAGLNIMRPIVRDKYKLGTFEFSEIYLTFWDKMEKANTFLEHIIEFRDRDPLDREMEILLSDPLPDGGWWRYVVDLIDKYGVVPNDVMPETNSSEKTRYMNALISRKLRTDAVALRKMYQEGKSVKKLRAEKDKMLAEVYKMLVINFGEPPTEFTWRYETSDSVVSDAKTYTPKSFYTDFVGVDLNDWVSVFNDPTKDYGKHYQIEMSRNMFDHQDIHFANEDVAKLKEIALAAVLDDQPVWFACDVGKDQNTKLGVMALGLYDFKTIYDTEWTMTKADQVLFQEATPNHAMVLTGVDIQDGKPVKWLVENSWGKDKGDEGMWNMYDSWFDEYVYNVIVRKQYVPQDILAVFEQTPIMVPPWDPMYRLVR
jgi:bleomycin hydrolase